MARATVSLVSALCLAVLPGLLAVAPAGAAPLAVVQADRDALAAGLQAQFEVALIRERKLADDRENALIGALEVKLKQARGQADQAKGDARQANAALISARTQYAELASRITDRDAAAASETKAFTEQAQTIARQASPEQLAALQRFADGDRTGAWPIIQASVLADARAAATPAAVRATDLRQLASLREVMRAHGEATTAEVLDFYDQAAALDPTNVRTQLERAKLAHDLGDLNRAKAAAQQAAAVAATDDDRAAAQRVIGEQAVSQRDFALAARSYAQALAAQRRIAQTDPTKKTQNDVAATLMDLGDLQVAQTDFAVARTSYQEGLAIRQRLAGADPADGVMQDYVASLLQRIGDLDFKTGDLTGARQAFDQGLAIRQKLSAADPANTDLQYFASAFLRRLGDLAYQQGDLATARTDYEKCLAIRQRVSAANPSSAQLQNAVALDFEDLAEVAFAQGDLISARTDNENSLRIRRRLATTDPTNADLQQLVLRSLARLARLPGAAITWGQVAEQYRAIKTAGHLTAGDEKVLQALKAHGAAGGL